MNEITFGGWGRGVSEALSGRLLDRALAEAMGWGAPCAEGAACVFAWTPSDPHWHDVDNHHQSKHAPAFSTSVDALAPVETKLRAAGWWQWIEAAGAHEFRVSWAEDHSIDVEPTIAHTEAEARARAALAALKALEGVKA